MPKKVSVIVLNWNGKEHLQDCFESLRHQSFEDFEVIMTDNASTDGSRDFVRQNFPKVKIFQNEENLGYTGANNAAAKIAEGEYLFFLNKDTKVHPDCLQELVTALDNAPKAAVCALKVLTFDGSAVSTCGCGVDFLGFIDLEPGYQLFFADGSSFFIRKSAFEKLGGFDPKHFIFNEELDLCWRAWIFGYKIILNSKAIIYHKVGATVTGGSFKKGDYTTSVWRRYLGERNALRNLLKNYSWLYLFWILPIYLAVNLGEMLVLAFSGRFGVIKDAYLKSYWYNIIKLSDTWRERRRIQSHRRVSDREIFARMSKEISKWATFRKIGVPKFQ
jgi:GT2 family glycosyltransferase